MGHCTVCTQQNPQLVYSSVDQAKGASPCKVSVFEHLSILQHCNISNFQVFQMFSTCSLTITSFVCMCQLLQDGQRQFSQTYGFITQSASEEDEESAAAAEEAVAATAAATAEAAEEAADACCCKLEET
jgi:hypothetical protein